MEIKSNDFSESRQKFESLIQKISPEDRVGLKKVVLANFQSIMEEYSELSARSALTKCIERANDPTPKKYWKTEQTQYLIYVVDKYCIAFNENADHFQEFDWYKIAECIPARDAQDCIFRLLSFHSNKISSLPWTPSECQLFQRILQEQKNAISLDWKEISKKLYKLNPEKIYRAPRQCKQRYHSYHKPNLKKGPWEEEEDYILILLFLKFGKKWQTFLRYINGRNQNAIKNRFAFLFEAKKDKKMAPSELLRAVRRKKQKLQKKREFSNDMLEFSDEENMIETTVRAESTANIECMKQVKIEEERERGANDRQHQCSQIFLPSKEIQQVSPEKGSEEADLSPTSRYIK